MSIGDPKQRYVSWERVIPCSFLAPRDGFLTRLLYMPWLSKSKVLSERETESFIKTTVIYLCPIGQPVGQNDKNR